MLKLQETLSNDLKAEEQTTVFEEFEEQQSLLPLVHARQAINLSRARAKLAESQKNLMQTQVCMSCML